MDELPILDDDFDRDERAKWRRLLADTRSVEELIQAALCDSDDDAQYEAIEVLQLRGNREVLTAAQELCTGPHDYQRRLGCTILGRLGNCAPLLRVARGLRMSGDDDMRTYADTLYQQLGADPANAQTFPKEVITTLTQMLQTEADNEILRDILCALAEYQDFHPSITEQIAAFRTHPDPAIRYTVSTRLALNLDSPIAQQALAELAHDDDEAIRRWVKHCQRLIEMRTSFNA